MKIIFNITLIFVTLILHNTLEAQVSVAATTGTTSGNYATVKGAFDKINDGTHKGSIVITIGNTNNQVITETAEAVLNNSGTGSAVYTDIRIIPGATNITVTSSIAGACCLPTGTIKLNLAQNVTIDGRQGSAGSIVDLTISNSNTSSWSSAVVFQGASSNVLKYCVLKSSNTATSGGVGTISLIDNNVSGGMGASNNVIEYCNVTKEGTNIPRRAIASKGASARENNNNIIRNNRIYDFSEFGIYLGNGTSDGYNRGTTIQNNTIYQPNAFATLSTNQIGICIGNPFATSGGEQGTFTVTGNTIGGNGSGGKWTCTTTSASYRIAAISINSITTAYTTISSNVIADFSVNLASTATDYSTFSGITVSLGKVYVFSNSIGKVNDPNSMLITRSSATTGGFVSGIHVNSTGNFSNRIIRNSIAGLSIITGSSNYSQLYGIYNNCSSTNPTDSVCNNSVRYFLATKVNYLYGIYGKGFISKNKVIDFDFTGSATFSEMKGIYWSGGASTGTDYRGVENNEIILGKNKTGTSVAVNDLVIGIHVSRGDAKIFHNSVLIEGSHTGTDNTISLLVDWSGTIEVRNNALYNERSGGTGKHYSISRTGTGTAYNSGNNAYIIGTAINNLMGVVAGADKTTLTNWSSTPIAETSSLFDYNTNKPVTTLFPLIAQDSLVIPGSSWLKSGVVSVVTSDIRNISRDASVPAIGAYEPIVGLPIDLLFLDGQSIGRKNLLTWATVSEWNTESFVIERSKNGFDWETIDMVLAAGYSNSLINYSNWDKDPYLLTYYRLKQYDKDGLMNLFGPIVLELDEQNLLDIAVYPNPTSDFIHVSLNDKTKKEISGIYLYSTDGKLVRTHDIENGDLIWINDLPEANYLLIINTIFNSDVFQLSIVR